ncbi:MAG: hypothetical protein LBU42_07600 [Prevotellaceae bacterium]|nr:hypothetical protein [Prevotellaceae bacterium]
MEQTLIYLAKLKTVIVVTVLRSAAIWCYARGTTNAMLVTFIAIVYRITKLYVSVDAEEYKYKI